MELISVILNICLVTRSFALTLSLLSPPLKSEMIAVQAPGRCGRDDLVIVGVQVKRR